MPHKQEILPLKRQFEIRDAILQERLQTVMPAVMRECGFDMWLILAAECNEDPVFHTIVPAVVDKASRMTCIAFTLDEQGVFGAYSINKPNRELARFYTQLPYSTDDQWERIAAFVRQQSPKRIGINVSPICGLCAGLSKSLYDELCAHLGPDASRLADADMLATRWLETRTERELAMYPAVYEVTTSVMSRAFSREVITPGVTTTQDVEDWAAEEFRQMGLPTCFRPTVNLQRQGWNESMITDVIRHGDLLHYDAGIQYLGLSTDLQRLAYILRPGEREAPDGICRGFETGHAFGRLTAGEFIAGRTGNEMFAQAKAKAAQSGMDATLYTHPIGLHCHAAGPTIGLYDKQDFIPGRGERRLHHNTAYALEFNVACPVAEWGGQKVHFYLEETVVYRTDGVLEYLDDDWHQLILI